MTARLIFDDVISGLARIQPFSVSAVVSSPPYWGRASYIDDSREIGAGTLAQYIDDTRTVFRHMLNVLTPDAIVWWNVGDTCVGSGGAGGDHAKGNSRENKSKYRQGDAGNLRDGQWADVPGRVLHALQDDGWLCRSQVVWAKKHPKQANPAHDRRPLEQHEMVYMLTRQLDYPWPVAPKWADFDPKFGELGDVWHIPVSRGEKAGKAPMPLELARRCVNLSPAGLVLDPFCGAGTTGVVALEAGRSFVGIDLDRHQLTIAARRLAVRIEDVEGLAA